MLSGEPGWAEWLIAALAVLGAGLIARGVRRLVQGLAAPPADDNSLNALRGFRLAMIGLALAGAGAGVLLDKLWLVVLSLGIAGEETFETSLMIWGLRRVPRRDKSR